MKKSAQRDANAAHCLCSQGPSSIPRYITHRVTGFPTYASNSGIRTQNCRNRECRNTNCPPRRGPSSISVPNLKWIAQFVQKLLRGPEIRKIRSRDPGHAHLAVGLWSLGSEVPSSMFVPNLKWIALFVQKLLGGPTFRPAADPLPRGAGRPKI